MATNQGTSIKKIAISTGGGDAPGLNAVIRATALSAIKRGWEVYGVRDGFHGILSPEEYPNGGFIPLTRERISGITHLGGTILGTSNRNNPLKYPVVHPDGTVEEVDRSDEIVRGFRLHHIDALITVGGDGSLAIASVLSKKGLRLISVPKTIDNDLDKTDVTFGFDTAVGFATEALDRLHSTAASHGRIMVVEVMGRYAGWIAIFAGVAGGADVILIPEIPYNYESICAKIRVRESAGKHFTLVIVAEGAREKDGQFVMSAGEESNRGARLGGSSLSVGSWVAGSLPQTKIIFSAFLSSDHFCSATESRQTRATYSLPPLIVRPLSFW